VQLVLIHGNQQPTMAATLGDWIWRAFPTGNTRLDRELAIGLTHLRRAGTIRHPVHARLLDQLTRGRDQAEQIHLFYCLRLLHDGWTPEQKARLLSWFDSTKTWSGGHSFAPYLEAILRDWNPVLTPTDRQAVIARAAQQPWAATAMLRLATPEQLPPPDALLTVYRQLMTTSGAEMREGLVESLAKQGVTALPALRTIGELDAGQRVAVGRALARHPVTADNLPHLVGGLEAVPPPLYAQEMIDALMKSALKPKADDARAVRGALLTAQRMPPERRWKVVELLRHWSGRRFGADDGDWKSELRDWTRWYRQTFPNAPPPPDLAASDRPTVAKYSQEDLLKLLTGSAAAKGDAARGRLAFTKASCVKCHKYGTEGQSIGPDLTTLSQRFQRKDMIEAIVDPSKVISDQYRSQLLVTTTGQTVAGIVAEQGDTLTVTLQDAAQVTLKKAEIEERFASLVSVMPEGLLDALTKEEIVDLFTYLESAPVAGR
jgi:putative heme-binding domain-containing protein